MELKWNLHWEVSCYYAASRLLGGATPVTPRGAKMAEPVGELARALDRAAGGSLRARHWLPAFAAQTDHAGQLAERVLVKALGRNAVTQAGIDEIRSACEAVLRAAAEDSPANREALAPRLRPLREAWDSVGPGLLWQMKRITEAELFVPQAVVFLVEPVVGGGGAACLDANAVLIEGVLTHPAPQLPETLRLAWLLSQLNNDLPVHSEAIQGPRKRRVSGLSMIPPTLVAGQELGLCRYDDATLALALEIWGEADFPGNALSSLKAWWGSYSDGKIPWRAALPALDRLLNLDD